MQEKIVTMVLFVKTSFKGFQVVHPILIVVNVALVRSWERELHLWASDVNVVNYLSKNEEARKIIQQVELNFNFGLFKPEVFFTTFEVFNNVNVLT
jgi:SNF2 family DNA or RNA helicase